MGKVIGERFVCISHSETAENDDDDEDEEDWEDEEIGG
jgi:hypothetical protein